MPTRLLPFARSEERVRENETFLSFSQFNGPFSSSQAFLARRVRVRGSLGGASHRSARARTPKSDLDGMQAFATKMLTDGTSFV